MKLEDWWGEAAGKQNRIDQVVKCLLYHAKDFGLDPRGNGEQPSFEWVGEVVRAGFSLGNGGGMKDTPQ